MDDRKVHLNRLTDHSFQAWHDGAEVFVIRQAADGWKTEGHPAFDGLLRGSMEELVAAIEGREA